jgi:hypothetical protein
MGARKYLMYGFIVGLSFLAIRLGYAEVTERISQTAQSLGIIFISATLFIKIIQFLKKGPVFNPKADNFLIGFSFSSAIVSFLLYGPSFP